MSTAEFVLLISCILQTASMFLFVKASMMIENLKDLEITDAEKVVKLTNICKRLVVCMLLFSLSILIQYIK